MAQIFHASSNTISRASLLLGMGAPVLLIGVLSGITRGTYNTGVGVPLEQPVPFSHQHHATELGIDCRYCHSGVEKSATAGLPPTHTCMSCHSQIWTNSPLLEPVRESYRTGTPIKSDEGEIGWNRVNKVPEFVYFNHSIHINRGINCNQCHGPVQKMQIAFKGKPFFMSWCLECHRNPENYLYRDEDSLQKGLSPREQVFNLYTKYQSGATLTKREESLLQGKEYTPTADEVTVGKQLVKDYHVQKKQLTDCWICHR